MTRRRRHSLLPSPRTGRLRSPPNTFSYAHCHQGAVATLSVQVFRTQSLRFLGLLKLQIVFIEETSPLRRFCHDEFLKFFRGAAGRDDSELTELLLQRGVKSSLLDRDLEAIEDCIGNATWRHEPA